MPGQRARRWSQGQRQVTAVHGAEDALPRGTLRAGKEALDRTLAEHPWGAGHPDLALLETTLSFSDSQLVKPSTLTEASKTMLA